MVSGRRKWGHIADYGTTVYLITQVIVDAVTFLYSYNRAFGIKEQPMIVGRDVCYQITMGASTNPRPFNVYFPLNWPVFCCRTFYDGPEVPNTKWFLK